VRVAMISRIPIPMIHQTADARGMTALPTT
jgi:hypothetical protein